MVMDGAGWHRNQDLVLAENRRLLTIPPYSPELNPVDEALEDHLETGLRSMEQMPEIVRSIFS